MSNTMSLGTTPVSLPNGISFRPTALAECTGVTDDTHRRTDDATVTCNTTNSLHVFGGFAADKNSAARRSATEGQSAVPIKTGFLVDNETVLQHCLEYYSCPVAVTVDTYYNFHGTRHHASQLSLYISGHEGCRT